MQPYVLVISLVLMVVVAAAFWWAARHSGIDASQAKVAGNVEGYRGGVFWATGPRSGLWSRSRRFGLGRTTCQPRVTP